MIPYSALSIIYALIAGEVPFIIMALLSTEQSTLFELI